MTNASPTLFEDEPFNPSILQLFRTPERYYRSVHLERDFHDPRALSQYVLTPSLRMPFDRVLDGLAPGSGRRAWRVTGDYGSGKSSFALVLAHLLHDADHPDLGAVRSALELPAPELPRLLPVLVTGHRAPLVEIVAQEAHKAFKDAGLSGEPAGREALKALRRAATNSDSRDLIAGLEAGRKAAEARGYGGVFIVLDELGKFLEEAALHPERDDVYALQQLAEMASRSGAHPFILLGLLHQGFQVYADRLTPEARQEWGKVAGRFEEITFDQPLAHTMALVQAALNVDTEALPLGTSTVASHLVQLTRRAGWLTGARDVRDDAFVKLYPLHPAVLPVLVRFFAQFGQNERSLYNFLLSHEPGTLQEFALRSAQADSWYTLADFYDYVRAAYGHSMGGSYRTHWSRMLDTIDAAIALPDDQLRLLKTVAILNVTEAEHLNASEAALEAALSVSTGGVEPALEALCAQGLLFQRGRGADYRLWPVTSVNLDQARGAALEALGHPETVAAWLPQLLGSQPILARRHAIEGGTLRYFEVRYVTPYTLAQAVGVPSTSDGAVVVVLCETPEDHEHAMQLTQELTFNAQLLVCITPPLRALAAELHEVRVWDWVVAHTPELAHDAYAQSEAARQQVAAKAVLAERLAPYVPLRVSRPDPGVRWVYGGEQIELPERGLTVQLSEMCDDIFNRAPLVHHELLNRHVLSSAGAAARMRLIEHMVRYARDPLLGFSSDKTPPEKSMYLSVLERGKVHRLISGVPTISLPQEDDDPLRLAPVLKAVLSQLRATPDARVSAQTLLDVMQRPPYGVRTGLAMLLLATVQVAHGHEIAMYEDGTFVPEVNAAVLQRLIRMPGTFHFQWAAVTGVRAAVFDQVAAALTRDLPGPDRKLLDVVTPLCVFVAQTLPEYTRRTKGLSPSTLRVRDVLRTALEPAGMLFRELPEAVELPMFAVDEVPDAARITDFVTELQRALSELREDYPKLLARIENALQEGLGLRRPLDREALAERSNAVALRSQNDVALRAFAMRLADLSLRDDAWLEAVASTVLAKPPRRWQPGDEDRFLVELTKLARKFRHVTLILDQADPGAGGVAFHIGLTSITGEARDEIVHLRTDQEACVRDTLLTLKSSLPPGRDEQLIAVSQLLWELLHGQKEPS